MVTVCRRVRERLFASLCATGGLTAWLSVCADAEHRNIASVAEWARSEMGLPLLAVACDRVAKEWGGVDAHVDYVSIHHRGS